ncbi:GFA family protein [Methyloglobulus sp.]|uniref:GFA family protein n=1 Tax=Methyloglobulus sp. TaxID=2518622 RepID=UPI003988D00A
MKLPITGGCLCGKVRYEISAKPVSTALCHCRTCQKAVGAPHFAALFVPASALTITGDHKEYASIAASGNTMYRGFCPECGTSLFGRNSAFTQIRPVSAVTLDDPSIYKPEKDIWVADAQPWDVMNPELPKFEGNSWK